MPSRPAHPLVSAVRTALADAADPARAPAMQRYMKSAMPFRGVPAPVQQRIWRAAAERYPLTSRRQWEAAARGLWRDAAFREERYAAIGVSDLPRYRAYRTRAALPLFEEWIVTGAWWDLVDPVATHHLGDALADDPVAMGRVMRRWASDPHLWKRRAAILCQLGRKGETDVTLLESCVAPNLSDRDFFIRKAIGWALRQYARTDPAYVRRYLRVHATDLSPLSRREAGKHLT